MQVNVAQGLRYWKTFNVDGGNIYIMEEGNEDV